MTLRSHGTVRSFSNVCVQYRRPLRRILHARRGNAVTGLLEPCRNHPRFFSSRSRASHLYRNHTKMAARKATHQVWDVSRGFVFAGGSSTVVYPRLPPVRHYSAPASPAFAACEEDAISSGARELSAGQGLENAGAGLAIPLTLTRSATQTILATPTTAILSKQGAKDGTEGVGSDVSKEAIAAESPVPEDPIKEALEPGETAPCVPPYTPLDFNMSEETFQKAKQAAEGTSESFWKYTMYRGPGDDAKVKVHYCTSSYTTERVIRQYFMNEKVLGFDLEWMPQALKTWGPRRNVSLIQLASPSRIGLFHIAAYPGKDILVAPSLKKVLEDPTITKVGVCIKGDCTRLSTFLHIKTQGQFELSHLYKLVKYSRSGEHNLVNRRMVSLSTQVEECLGLPLFKGGDVRTSDWTRPLQMDQIIYSASDAYAAVQLYAVLDHQRKNLDPVPPLPHHAELNLPIKLADQVIRAVETEEQEAAPDAAAEEAALPGDEVEYLEPCPADSVSATPDPDVADQTAPDSSSQTKNP